MRERIPLAEYLHTIEKNVKDLRLELRGKAKAVFETIPPLGLRISGAYYIESAGTIVEFTDGAMEHMYIPNALFARDRIIDYWDASRKGLFAKIAQQFPHQARILNIGAGGDLTPIRAMLENHHEIISTDMAEDVIHLLKKRIDVPAFSGDLIYLSRLLPEPLDFFIGNSTLAYVEPAKLLKVISNIYEKMDKGGVFTFDLTPNHLYFNMVSGQEEETILNESDVDPRKLISYIKKYGNEDGINAMAYYNFYRLAAMNISMIDILKKIFENLGAKCLTGIFKLRGKDGGIGSCLTLRVSKNYDQILAGIEGEILYSSGPEGFMRLQTAPPAYKIGYIDRESGAELARLLGIRCDAKSAPWIVADYIEEHQDSRQLSTVVKEEVLAELEPDAIVDRIWPYINGQKQHVPPKPLRQDIAFDQYMHKAVFTGEQPISREEADMRIDIKYNQARERLKQDADRMASERTEEDEKRADRNRKKANRRKQRGK